MNVVCSKKNIYIYIYIYILMVLFLLILGWSLLRPLGWSNGSDRQTTCNLHKKGDPAGVCRLLLRWQNQFFPYEKNSIVFYGVIAAYLSVVERVGIYKGR